jgi:hypothetical protein
MGGRRGVPLQDRIRVGPDGQRIGPARPEPATSSLTEPASPARRRHCWVLRPPHHGEMEGLVLQWSQEQHGWVALVMYVVEHSDGPIAVQEWLAAEWLRPA